MGRLARQLLRILGVSLAVLLLASAGLLWWVGQSTSFVRWALGQAVASSGGAFEVGAVQGSLAGGVRIASLRWRGAGYGEVELHGLALAWRPDRLLQGELRLSRVEIGTVTLRLAPSEEPFSLPASLRLPMPFALDALGIGRLTVTSPDSAPIVLERVSLAMRYRAGTYRIRHLAAHSTQWGEAQLRASLGDSAPYALELSGMVAARVAGWSAIPQIKVLADGTLEDFALAAQALPPPGVVALGDASAPAPVWLALDTRVRTDAPADERLAPIQLTLNGVEPAQLGLPTTLRARLAGSATIRLGHGQASGRLELRNALAGAWDARAIPLDSLASGFTWAGEHLAVDGLHATLAGGATLQGDAAIDFSRMLTVWGRRLPATTAQLRVQALDLARLESSLATTRLSGRIGADDDALRIELSDASRQGIAASVQVRLANARARIEHAQVRSAAGTLSTRGSVALVAPYELDLAGEFSAVDPVAVLRLQSALGGAVLPEWLSPAWLARLDGALSGRWAASGRAWPQPLLATRLAIDQGQLDGQPLRLDWSGELSPDRLSDVTLRLASGDLGARASGSFGHVGDRLRFVLKAASLARLEPGLAGSLSVEGELSGGWRAAVPLGIKADFGARALAWQERLQVATVSGHIEMPNLDAGRVALRIDAEALQFSGQRLDRISARADGAIDAHSLQLDASGPQLKAHAAAHGALAHAPDWRWSGMLDALSVAAPLTARLEAPAPLAVQADLLVLGAAALGIDGGRVQLAELSLRGGQIAIRGEASALPLGRWAERFTAATVASGQGQAAGATRVSFEDLRLGGSWDLSGNSIERASGRVVLRLDAGEVPGAGGSADVRLIDGRLDGTVDLRIPSLAFANRLIGPEWAMAGRLRFAGSVAGTVRTPQLRGDLSGRDLALLQRTLGWRLSGGILNARFEGDRLELAVLRLESGQGSVTMDGQLALEGLVGDFRLRADHLPVPFGPGQRVVMSGESRVSSRGSAFEWKGKIHADEGLIELRGGDAPILPDDVVVIADKTAASQRQAPAPAAGGLQIGADLSLDLGEHLRVRGSGIDVLLAGTLELRGTLPDAPRAYGTVRVREGTYAAYGQKLEITRGQVIFNGPLDNPLLDIVAMRRNQPVQAGVSLTGTVLSPRIRLVSSPDVPDSQKLSWLVLGVGLDDARSGGQMAALQAAAATLFGQNDGGLTGELSRAFGLDLLAVRGANGGAVFDPNFGASFPGQAGTVGVPTGTAAENVLAVGKRLSSRVFVTYEQGLRGVWNVFRVQYDITHRLSVRGQTGTDSALDILYFYSFD